MRKCQKDQQMMGMNGESMVKKQSLIPNTQGVLYCVYRYLFPNNFSQFVQSLIYIYIYPFELIYAGTTTGVLTR